MMIWPEWLGRMKVTKEDMPQIIDKYLTLEQSEPAKPFASRALRLPPHDSSS